MKKAFILFFFSAALLFSCTKIALYQKVKAIPKNSWQSNYIPSFTFTITDTAAAYQLYLILRHNNKYNYNNIWVNLYMQAPDGSRSKAPYELLLATNEKGWLGTGMDDLYEHRIPLTPLNRQFYFKKSGTYTFRIQHIMREDPLENVMNVGLRIEKK